MITREPARGRQPGQGQQYLLVHVQGHGGVVGRQLPAR